MQKKQVAVLDVGSSKITAVIAERGINKTFILKASSSCEYDGFAEGEFLSEESLKNALLSSIQSLKKSANAKISTLYVGVPAVFTSVFVKNSQVSLKKKKKITEQDVESLYDAAFIVTPNNYTLINRSPIIYELDDARKLVKCVGEESETLKATLSFVFCKNSFIDTIQLVLSNLGIEKIEFISTSLSEAMYLVDDEMRDRTAVILDVGYITSSFSVIRGDGLIYEKAFDYGGGYITAAITQKFGIDFDEAESLKRKVNLGRKTDKNVDIITVSENVYVSLAELKNIVKFSLDDLCEKLTEITDNLGFDIPEYVPLMITGGGISYIRGGKEHLSNRLGCMVEILKPAVPMMDEPNLASTLSLLDLALSQE